MPAPDSLAISYASDEEVYITAHADYWVVAPASNLMAGGADGIFLTNDLWTLNSATNNFTSQGVVSGMLVELSQTPPITSVKATPGPFRHPQTLAIDSATSSSITLRRVGKALNVGLPPGPVNGVQGVTFRVLTLGPKIEEAAYELNEQYSIDPTMSGRSPGNMRDQRIFRRLTALWVMWDLYGSIAREKDNDITAKVVRYENLYRDELAKAVVRWGPRGTDAPSTTRFSMRIGR